METEIPWIAPSMGTPHVAVFGSGFGGPVRMSCKWSLFYSIALTLLEADLGKSTTSATRTQATSKHQFVTSSRKATPLLIHVMSLSFLSASTSPTVVVAETKQKRSVSPRSSSDSADPIPPRIARSSWQERSLCYRTQNFNGKFSKIPPLPVRN